MRWRAKKPLVVGCFHILPAILRTGTPRLGDMTAREGLEFLRELTGVYILRGVIVEVASIYNPTINSAQLGAQTLFEEC